MKTYLDCIPCFFKQAIESCCRLPPYNEINFLKVPKYAILIVKRKYKKERDKATNHNQLYPTNIKK